MGGLWFGTKRKKGKKSNESHGQHKSQKKTNALVNIPVNGCHGLTYECKLCMKLFNSQPEAETHLIYVHSLRGKHKCPHCEFTASTIEKGLLHTQKKHEGEDQKLVALISEVRSDRLSSDDEDDDGHPSQLVGCSSSSSATTSSHPSISWNCLFCEAQVISYKQMFNHTKEHLNYTPYSCLKCHFHTFKKREIMEHIDTHTFEPGEERTYYLQKKLQIESWIKRYIDQVVFGNNLLDTEKLYKPEDHISSPIWSMNGDATRTYFCPFCRDSSTFSGAFTTMASMKTHLSNHLFYRPYLCIFCGEDYPSYDQVCEHFVEVHPKVRMKNDSFFSYLPIEKVEFYIEEVIVKFNHSSGSTPRRSPRFSPRHSDNYSSFSAFIRKSPAAPKYSSWALSGQTNGETSRTQKSRAIGGPPDSLKIHGHKGYVVEFTPAVESTASNCTFNGTPSKEPEEQRHLTPSESSDRLMGPIGQTAQENYPQAETLRSTSTEPITPSLTIKKSGHPGLHFVNKYLVFVPECDTYLRLPVKKTYFQKRMQPKVTIEHCLIDPDIGVREDLTMTETELRQINATTNCDTEVHLDAGGEENGVPRIGQPSANRVQEQRSTETSPGKGGKLTRASNVSVKEKELSLHLQQREAQYSALFTSYTNRVLTKAKEPITGSKSSMRLSRPPIKIRISLEENLSEKSFRVSII